MRTILLVSELGGGRGHTMRLSATASVARRMRFRTVLASSSQKAIKRGSENWTFDQCCEAPRFPRLKNTPDAFKVNGLAASLAKVGFVDDQIIATLVMQWQALISQVKPSLIVGDFAPYARIAAFGRVPFLMVGSGYSLPTTDGLAPFPSSNSRRDPAQLIGHILEQLNRGLASIGTKLIDDPSECLRGDWNAVACIPLLDPTKGRNPHEYFGPFEDFPHAPMKKEQGNSVYAYLHSAPERDCDAINGILEAGYSIDLYCDGPIQGSLENAVKLATPLSLDQVAEKYSFVLHQGGLGLSTFCLQAALPQIFNPKHTEAYMTAQKLNAHGCGAFLTSPRQTGVEDNFERRLNQFAEDQATKRRLNYAANTRRWIANQNWNARIEAIFAAS